MKGKVWLYPGDAAAWHFVNIDKKVAALIKEAPAKRARGFGSLRVVVQIGTTSWQTSIFPDKKSGTYLLPLKASIRQREGVQAGDTIKFSIKLR